MIDDFLFAFVRPLFAPVSVAGFLSAARVDWAIIAAAFFGLYLTLLEIGRQGGWK